MGVSREQVEEGRRANLKIRGRDGGSAPPVAQQPQWVENRRVRRAAAKKGKKLTPAQIARRLKWEKQQEENRKRAIKFKLLCSAEGIPFPVQEFMFAAPEREWRLDFCWVEEKVALEVEGGVWSGGRHTSGSGWTRDAEKYNELSLRGWILLRVTPGQLCKPSTLDLVRRALDARAVAEREA